MDQAQMFKRLYMITLDEINSFIDKNLDFESALYKLNLAACTRKIINHIQLEDIWQSIPDEGEKILVFLSMRLSPKTLLSGINFNNDMNNFLWQLVFPKYQELPNDKKPIYFGDYLSLMKEIQIINVDQYDVEKTCQFLDLVYDFSLLKSPSHRFN